jgi:hypothetical protein
MSIFNGGFPPNYAGSTFLFVDVAPKKVINVPDEEKT